MCGLIGFTSSKHQKYLDIGLEKISYRGYDDRAKYIDSNICLGMNRLAIVDLTKGLYPMRYKNYLLIYNGEIYNYKELKKKLEQKGVFFFTNSDSEVILPLFDLYGEKAFSMLEGMFAICVYDSKHKKLILARDKFGEKPLYYTHQNGIFAFSSEIKALLILPFVKKQLNLKTLPQYLSQGYVGGHNTLVNNIYKLKSAQYLLFNIATEKITTGFFWNINTKKNTFSGSINDAAHQTKILLQNAVASRMLSDVPVGCFLSGGLDSSLVAYYASQLHPKINTYSVAFPHSLHHDESQFAKNVAKQLNTNHHEIICTEKDIKHTAENIGFFIDEPICDPAFIPTFIMARRARKKVKVVLTGEGGDEVFAGYYRYLRQLLAEKTRKNTVILKIARRINKITNFKRLNNLAKNISDRYHTQHIWTDAEIKELVHLERDQNKDNDFDKFDSQPLISMQAKDIKNYLADQLFTMVDKSTMANNLEARSPFVETNLVKFALSLPNDFKVRGIHTKLVLRKVARKYFPFWFSWRPKHGFSVPLGKWLKDILLDGIYESLEDIRRYIPNINTDLYQKAITEHVASKRNNTDKIWSLFVLYKWLKANKIVYE